MKLKSKWTYDELTKLTISTVADYYADPKDGGVSDLLATGALIFWFRLTLQEMEKQEGVRGKCLVH